MMALKVFLMSVVGGLAVLLQFEVQNDILYVEKEVVLPSSRAKTFLYLSEIRNLKNWFPGVDNAEPVDNSAMGVGKHFTKSTSVKLYGDVSASCTVLGYDTPHFISYVCDSWLTRPRVELTLDHNENNAKYPTKLVYKEYSRRRSYLFNYMVSPVVGYVYSYLRRQGLFALRYQLQER